jgi:signal transduction histidine kinase
MDRLSDQVTNRTIACDNFVLCLNEMFIGTASAHLGENKKLYKSSEVLVIFIYCGAVPAFVECWHAICIRSRGGLQAQAHMDAFQSVKVAPHKRAWNLDRIFDAARKDTVIRLRWPLVILSSYILYYNPTAWLSESHVQAILGLYLLSHATLYFLADDLFDSPYFYGPLLLFDSLVLIVALSISGTANDNFFLACLITVVLSTICRDGLGLLVITLLAPLVYAYSVFSTSSVVPPEIYLQLPIPFVISLFYGYFAQVGRMRRNAKEKDAEIKKEQRAAEELRRQRERLVALHEINVSATSTIDTATILDAFLDKTLIHLPYAATIVRLKSDPSAALGTVVAKGLEAKNTLRGEVLDYIDGIMAGEMPLMVRNVFSDPRVVNFAFFKQEGLVSFIALPLSANNQKLGCVVFLTRDEHEFAAEEVGFLSTLSGQVAIALHHAELFRRSTEQADELRHAHKIKDSFLKNVSDKLNEPLSVITGYAEMFSQGLLGVTTPIQEKAVENIGRYSRELHGVIDTVLQVSDIESEPLGPSLNETNLWEFFSELRLLYNTPLERDVKIHWDYPTDVSIFLCDRYKLRCILENLINNAIRFTDHGRITISARHSAVRQELQIQVADTGVGIPAARLPKIFQKFGPLESADTDPKHSGVGLGLYLVKKYTDILGGRLNVESRHGEGSVFTLRIPALVPKVTPAHEQLLLLPTAIENHPRGN